MLLATVLALPAWAVNQCRGADGRVVFQDAPCASAQPTVGEDMQRRKAAAAKEAEERNARLAAEARAWEAQKRTSGFTDSTATLNAARIRCGQQFSELPKVGMTEATFLNCTEFGVLRRADRVNQTETVGGVLKQFVYPSTSDVRYVYTRNGVVTTIQR